MFTFYPPCGHPPGVRAGGRLAVLLLASLLVVVLSGQVSAQSRSSGVRVGIGAGILGAIILNDLAQTEPRAEQQPRRHGSARRSGSRSSSARQQDKDETARRKKRYATSSRSSKQKKVEPEVSEAPRTESPSPITPEKPVSPMPTATAVATSEPRADPIGSAGDKSLVAPNTTAGLVPISTPGQIKSAQEHLKFLGYEVPEATGSIDLKTKIAIMQFQESIGAPLTGSLTVEQLHALFVTAARQSAATN
jgi:Putative peptidoglycan binding domain